MTTDPRTSLGVRSLALALWGLCGCVTPPPVEPLPVEPGTCTYGAGFPNDNVIQLMVEPGVLVDGGFVPLEDGQPLEVYANPAPEHEPHAAFVAEVAVRATPTVGTPAGPTVCGFVELLWKRNDTTGVPFHQVDQAWVSAPLLMSAGDDPDGFDGGAGLGWDFYVTLPAQGGGRLYGRGLMHAVAVNRVGYLSGH